MVKGQRSRLVEGGEAEVEEDDKDEYRAPYMARQMSSVETRTLGDMLP
jgi:hypothetical protein